MPNKLTMADLKSPIGAITLLVEDGKVIVCEFSDREERVARQLRQYYSGSLVTAGDAPIGIKSAFDAYFSGDRDALTNLPASPKGTPYEQSVWQMLRTIQAGNTVSYGSLATQLRSSARAIGRANGRNPISLLFPCHRVIGANGDLTGYAGGLNRKEWLLKHEGAVFNYRRRLNLQLVPDGL